MKKASRIMYTIGRVFNIIGIVFFILFAILMACAAFNDEFLIEVAKEMQKPLQETKDLCVACFVLFLIEAIIHVATIIIATIASKSIKREDGRLAPHITMIVVGAVSWDVFYLLGGIFGTLTAKK